MRIIYLPVDPQSWNPVVDLQVAVKLAVIVVVLVMVVVEVPKARRKRPEAASLGAENPGWMTKGTGGDSRTVRAASTSGAATGSSTLI